MAEENDAARSPGARFRLVWSIAARFVVESLVFGLAVLPAALFWQWHYGWEFDPAWFRVTILAMAAIPTYFVFSVAFMVLSALSMRLMGWRPPPRAELRINAFEWPLLDWVRYTISLHLVRVLAGTFLRITPIWTLYMRLNGANIEVGVEAGPECQIGALSAVPKFQTLDGHSTYAGISARKIAPRQADTAPLRHTPRAAATGLG